MSRYRKVDSRIWNDANFAALSDDGKLVFLMLLTHPGMTALGAMRATMTGLASELEWLPERFAKGFQECFSKGMAEADQKAHLIALPNFLKYNPPENPNVVKAWVGARDLLPECHLKGLVLSRAYQAITGRGKGFEQAFRQGFGEPLPKPFANGMPNQEQEPEQEQEPDTALPRTLTGELGTARGNRK